MPTKDWRVDRRHHEAAILVAIPTMASGITSRQLPIGSSVIVRRRFQWNNHDRRRTSGSGRNGVRREGLVGLIDEVRAYNCALWRGELR